MLSELLWEEMHKHFTSLDVASPVRGAQTLTINSAASLQSLDFFKCANRISPFTPIGFLQKCQSYLSNHKWYSRGSVCGWSLFWSQSTVCCPKTMDPREPARAMDPEGQTEGQGHWRRRQTQRRVRGGRLGHVRFRCCHLQLSAGMWTDTDTDTDTEAPNNIYFPFPGANTSERQKKHERQNFNV